MAWRDIASALGRCHQHPAPDPYIATYFASLPTSHGQTESIAKFSLLLLDYLATRQISRVPHQHTHTHSNRELSSLRAALYSTRGLQANINNVLEPSSFRAVGLYRSGSQCVWAGVCRLFHPPPLPFACLTACLSFGADA